MKTIVASVRMLLVMTVLTGFVYTGVVTLLGQVFFPKQANGTLVTKADKVIGSQLIQQKFTQEKYFWGRPSAGDFATLPSGASNLAPTSMVLKNQVDERRSALKKSHPEQLERVVPKDLLFASGSGIDPHISLEAAEYQVGRVARARGLSANEVHGLLVKLGEQRQWGFLGEPIVNVLKLNMELDNLK